MLRYSPGSSAAGGDVVAAGQRLGRLAEAPAGAKRLRVRVRHLGLIAKALSHPAQCRLRVATVEPVDEPHREEVAAAGGELAADAGAFDRLAGELRQRNPDDVEPVEAPVLEGVRVDAGELQALRIERVLVDDQGALGLEEAKVLRERGGIHGNEDVDHVARRVDVARGELDLEARDAGERPLGGADLGREVGKRRDVVAGERGGVGELAAGELHARRRNRRRSARPRSRALRPAWRPCGGHCRSSSCEGVGTRRENRQGSGQLYPHFDCAG